MVSEIYATGMNGTSAFAVVEGGVMVHHGSHKWGVFIDFEGRSTPVNDDDCELMAVVCGLLMCRNNGRRAVNVYTGRDDCQRRYYRLLSCSVFADSLRASCDGIDVFAERWSDVFFDNGRYVENPYKSFVESLTKE